MCFGNYLVKLTSTTVATYVKLILALGVDSIYATEFMSYLSNHVRSSEISVPVSVIEEIVKSIGAEHILTMLSLLELSYCPDGAQRQARPRPDISKFVTVTDVLALKKAEGKLKLISNFVRENKDKTDKADKVWR